jgi:LysM repeat protein
MNFNFPKLPKINLPTEGTLKEPDIHGPKKFDIPQIDQAGPADESPILSTNKPESAVPVIHNEDILGSGRLRLPPQARPQGKPQIPVELPGHEPKQQGPKSKPTQGPKPAQESKPTQEYKPTQDTHESKPRADKAEQLEKTDEFPIENERPAGDPIEEPQGDGESATNNFLIETIIQEPEAQTQPQTLPEEQISSTRQPLRATEKTEKQNENGSVSQQQTTTETVSIAEIVASTTSKLYSIEIGQSLEQVAQELGMDVFDLLRANPQLLKDPLIFAGQRIKLPAVVAQNELHTGNRTLETTLLTGPAKQQHTVETMKLSLTEKHSIEIEPAKTTMAETRSGQIAGARGSGPLSIAQEPAIAKEDRETKPRTQRSETERAEERKPEVKQHELVVPILGVPGNIEHEDKTIEEQKQRRSDHTLPEPFDEWADYIYKAAGNYYLEPSLIASVIWRESGGKNITSKDGHRHGLMQIDDRRYADWLAAHANGLDPASNIDFGASLLRQNIDHFRGKAAAGIAAYDCGIDAVEEALVLGKLVDHFTRDGNYSITVLTQQEFFKRFF